ncbi:hypothetical protein F3J45_11535 [Pantoea sp. Ap-967]|uniref:alpha-xenorhabdolysin family binary toxin subunit B n=1 Tax=Pantoea sp. Ap-967 TaxID=2608362 RepID=UPI001421B533|nr:alpha-xenorhabdolysin family binary toxin subunit B [Pantoea sp. Ap-967]NIE75066.1 hypothetical protein [Pantoea sp. Ap-967]
MVNETRSLPDVNVMTQAEDKIRTLYHGHTATVLPAVRERLLDLASLVKAGNDMLRESVLSSLVSLNLEFDQYPASEEDDLLRLRQSVAADMAQVVLAAERVQGYRDPNIAALKAEQGKVVLQVQTSIDAQKALVAAQEARLKEIDALLQTLEKPSVTQALRGLLPEPKDIEVVIGTLKDPTVSPELVKAALENLNKHLDLLEQGRKLSDVFMSRRRLGEALNEQRITLEQIQLQLSKEQAGQLQYESIEQLLAERQTWLQQVNRFCDSWKALSQTVAAATQPPALKSALEEVRDYLVSVRRAIEAV